MKQKMKKIAQLVLIFICQLTFSQVGIGTTTPDPSSILDIKSTNSGILIPRLTGAQRIAITAPTESLMVFDTDAKLYYYYTNSAWNPMNIGIIKSITTTSYTLTVEDSGKILDFTNNTPIVVTIPSGLPIGYQISITQAGTGAITLTPATGVTARNRWNGFVTSGQWAKVGLEVRALNNVIISGDVK